MTATCSVQVSKKVNIMYTRTSQSVKQLIIGLFCFAVKLRCNKRDELLWGHFMQFFHKTYVMSITVKDASKLQATACAAKLDWSKRSSNLALGTTWEDDAAWIRLIINHSLVPSCVTANSSSVHYSLFLSRYPLLYPLFPVRCGRVPRYRLAVWNARWNTLCLLR